MVIPERYREAARIVNDAGGTLVGRTRLQKITYLAQLAGFGGNFEFRYRHFGPFSEDLADGMAIASGLKLVDEKEHHAEWGGRYSVYTATEHTPLTENPARAEFIREMSGIGAIELELAATAAFLYNEEGVSDPWEETARRKPQKASPERIQHAKDAYRRLLSAQTPRMLPQIA